MSDPSGTIANPLAVIKHTSRAEMRQKLLKLVQQNEVFGYIVGIPLDFDGEAGQSALRR